jgi:hypothetical protein
MRMYVDANTNVGYVTCVCVDVATLRIVTSYKMAVLIFMGAGN